VFPTEGTAGSERKIKVHQPRPPQRTTETDVPQTTEKRHPKVLDCLFACKVSVIFILSNYKEYASNFGLIFSHALFCMRGQDNKG